MNRQGEVWEDGIVSANDEQLFLVVGPAVMTLGGHMHPTLNLCTGERRNVHEYLRQPFEEMAGFTRLV